MDLSSSSFHHNASIGSLHVADSSIVRKSPIVDKGLQIYLQKKTNRSALKWGSLNIVILSIILFDIKNKCPYAFSNWYYLEYATAVLLGLSVAYYFAKYFYSWLTFEPLKGTSQQRRLLHFDEGGKLT